jgi:uncharacterized protein
VPATSHAAADSRILYEVVHCLARTGTPDPELRDGCYVVVRFGYEENTDFDDGRDKYLGENIVHMGEAPYLLGAFDLLAAFLTWAVPSFEDLDHFEDDLPEDDRHLAPEIHQIPPARRPIGCLLLGCFTGPLDIFFNPDGFMADNFYLGKAPALLSDARFVFLASAAPPWHDEAYGILRLPGAGMVDPVADRVG